MKAFKVTRDKLVNTAVNYSEDDCEFQKRFVQQAVWETSEQGETEQSFCKEYPYSTSTYYSPKFQWPRTLGDFLSQLH